MSWNTSDTSILFFMKGKELKVVFLYSGNIREPTTKACQIALGCKLTLVVVQSLSQVQLEFSVLVCVVILFFKLIFKS